MLPSTPPTANNVLFHETPLETIYVTDETAKAAYQAKTPWNNYEIVVLPAGIEELEKDMTSPTIVNYYDLGGRQFSGKQHGTVIVRYSDGTTRKVLVK